ncbi:MAG: hypothetical protein KGJ37_04145 [Verrucomicrobiota bacterium]|nr:hypothetical protein [Verrucomicrobiota bacterium]
MQFIEAAKGSDLFMGGISRSSIGPPPAAKTDVATRTSLDGMAWCAQVR